MTNIRDVIGTDLRERRKARGVKAIHLAAAIGVTHGRVSQIERPERVSTEVAARYLAALATLPDVSKKGAR